MKGPDGETSFIGLIRVLHRWRRPVLLLAVGLPVITAIAVLFVPNIYTARGTILLETSVGDAGSEILGEISALAGLRSQTPSTDIYLAILSSRRVSSAVVDSLDLVTHFGTDADPPERAMEITLKELNQRVAFENPDAVTIRIAATDRDPQMAADIVNVYLHELEKANQTLSLSRARRTREMVENALHQTQRDLVSARQRLGEFQETYGVFALDEQTKSTLDLIAVLQGQLIEAQTEREALGGYRQEESAQLRDLDLRIEALRSQIDRLVGRMGRPAADNPGEEDEALWDKERDDFFLPLTTVPKLTESYSHILMDVTVQEAKYSVLATRLEQTKIEESQSIPSFEVLDRAERPFRKRGPNRTMYCLAALLGGILGGILLAVFLEDIHKRVDEPTRQELHGMLPGFLQRRILKQR